jgi:antitoxin component YwqK of YwqJK toxin-antitoxin module
MTYLSGNLQGESKTYYQEGAIKTVFNYENNLREGIYREFYESGKIKVEGEYSNDLKNGKWLSYDEEGAILKTEKFKKGEQR